VKKLEVTNRYRDRDRSLERLRSEVHAQSKRKELSALASYSIHEEQRHCHSTAGTG
jgi:hypothetical protein